MRPDGSEAPLTLRDQKVVCLSSIDWNFLWQGHQEIMSRFAKAGNSVAFVENTGVRTIGLRDLARVGRRLANWSSDRRGRARHPAPGVTVIAPLLVPFPRSRLGRLINERMLIPRLASQLRSMAGTDPVVFTFLPTPNALRIIELTAGPRSVVVYYCIADFQELSDLGAQLTRSEQSLARRADLVFVQGDAFAKRLAPFNGNIHEFRFGVNLDLFDPDQVARDASELAHLPRPIVGYTGGLHRHVDFGLLAEVARAIPDGSLVLIGPLVSEPGEALRAEPNVHFLGARPIRDLPRLVADFDAAIVPYGRTAYTDTVFPTKLHEYLTMGKAVVSTDLPEVVKLRLPDFAVRIAHDSAEFVRAVIDAVADHDHAHTAERTRLGRSRDWRAIVSDMAALISEEVLRKH